MRTLAFVCLIAAATTLPAAPAAGIAVSGITVAGIGAAGIGAALRLDGQHVIVEKVLPGSPAEASKAVQVGDRILAVGNENDPPVETKGLTLSEAVALVRGAKGSTVRLTLVPKDKDESQARVVSLVRGELKTRFFFGDLLAVGSKAPKLEMITLPGKKTEKLADYSGKIVVLEFWSTWCRPCQDAMAKLQTFAGQYPDWKDKVVLISVSIDDDADAASKHLAAKGWDQTHNVWIAEAAVKDFHVNGIPAVYLLDADGKIVDAGHLTDIPEAVNRLLLKAK